LPESRPSTPTDEKRDDTTTSSIKHSAAAVPESDMSSARKPPTPVDNSDDDMYVPPSEAEVERNLYDGFHSPFHICDHVDDQFVPPPVVEGAIVDGDDDDEALSYVSDNANLSTNSDPAEEYPAMAVVNLDSGPSDKAMVVDEIEDNDIMELDQDEDHHHPTTLNLKVVPLLKFYGSTKGKQKAITKIRDPAADVDRGECDDVVVIDPAPKCVSTFRQTYKCKLVL
jgi:hypothetical protein